MLAILNDPVVVAILFSSLALFVIMTLLKPTGPAAPARPEFSPRRAAAMIIFAWFPPLMLFCFLPRFVPLFDRWKGNKPPLTVELTEAGRLGYLPLLLAGSVVLIVLALGCAALVRAKMPGRQSLVLALSVFGLAGFFPLLLWGMMGPILTFQVVQ